MNFKHTFNAQLQWSKNVESSGKKSYPKTHQVSINGKPPLKVSAAKAFKGDPALHNPEDLLLSSLMSCHMMSYLYVCTQQGIDVLSYSDEGCAILETKPDGSGKIIEVRLTPKVVIADPSKIELALALHVQANKLCFIANSCNFPVLHQASCIAG